MMICCRSEKRWLRAGRGVGIAALLLILVSPFTVAAEYEQAGMLKAESILDPGILQGAHHKVDGAVRNDGMFNHYTVASPFGQFTPSSNSGLQVLINEIGAIAEMKKVATDETLVESVKQSGKNTVEGVKRLFSEPEETLEGAAQGVNSLFSRAQQTVGKRQVADVEDNQAKQLIGFSRSKGEIANRYGVNVYSRNQVLQAELDRLAWADLAGGLGFGAARGVVTGGLAGMMLSTSEAARLLNEAINTTPASELWVQNKNKLLAMGLDDDTVTLFLNNHVFSPALTTIMTRALEGLAGVENRELLIKVALQANSPDMAKVITEIAAFTAAYHTRIKPLRRLTPLARITRAERADGATVVLLPVDYLIWTEQVAELVMSLSTQKGAELWVSGALSPLARSEMEKLDWKIQTEARAQLSQE